MSDSNYSHMLTVYILDGRLLNVQCTFFIGHVMLQSMAWPNSLNREGTVRFINGRMMATVAHLVNTEGKLINSPLP